MGADERQRQGAEQSELRAVLANLESGISASEVQSFELAFTVFQYMPPTQVAHSRDGAPSESSKCAA